MGFSTDKTNTWEAPAELQTSTPRRVQLTRLGMTTNILAGVIAVVAVTLTGFMMNQAEADATRWKAWQADATPVRGQITYMRQTISGKNRVYRVEYSYPVGNLTYGGAGRVDQREWKYMREGDSIRVFYRRGQPGQSWISGHEPKGMPWWVAPLTGTAMLIGPVLMMWNLRRQRRLLEEGLPAKATVTRVSLVRQQKGPPVYRVSYSFQTENGESLTGRSQSRTEAPSEGTAITILYLPNNAKRNAQYPLCMVRVATFG